MVGNATNQPTQLNQLNQQTREAILSICWMLVIAPMCLVEIIVAIWWQRLQDQSSDDGTNNNNGDSNNDDSNNTDHHSGLLGVIYFPIIWYFLLYSCVSYGVAARNQNAAQRAPVVA
jgi:hypothetical protein